MKKINNNKLFALCALVSITTLMLLISGCGSNCEKATVATPTPVPTATPMPTPKPLPTPGPSYGAGRIAFLADNNDGHFDIYTMNSDKTNLIKVTNSASRPETPTISRDGTKIVFADTRNGKSDIYSVSANGGTETRITNGDFQYRYPVFSPDGTKIVYITADGDSYVGLVRVMNANGSNQRIVGDFSLKSEPKWSPDGTKIVYVKTDLQISLAVGAPPAKDIYTMNSTDGSDVKRITTGQTVDFIAGDTLFRYYESSYSPSYSPDGRYIAFSKNDIPRLTGSENNIYKINADGSNKQRIAPYNTSAYYPSWSPDSSKILFNSNPSRSNDEIYVVNADGNGPQNLTNTIENEIYATWGGN
jgi:Tol biopolymer transport system component